MSDEAAFARLVHALEPWRAQIVFVGGWAHALYRHHPRANTLEYAPILTRDTDLAIADRTPIEGDIRQALLDSGFTEHLSGDHRPPVTQYSLGEDDRGFYAEFLTPLVGSGVRRGGEVDATTSVGGVTAQKLRHLDILLIDPWAIEIGPEKGVPLSHSRDVMVPNPVSFIVQKLLIHADRPDRKRAQDLLYIHDTVELFGGMLPELQEIWNTIVRPGLHHRAAQDVVRLSEEVFAKVTDTIREAARIPQDRELRPDVVQQVCRTALVTMLA